MTRTLPERMMAIEISRFGGPEVLKPAQIPVPRITAGDVLVKVVAAGVNRPDIMQRRGLYPAPPGASKIPGLEISGEIVKIGSAVSRRAVGERICALTTGGGYGEYCAVPAPLCLPVPEGLALKEAAALPETFFTVWSNVFDRGALKKGETFMVHGGTSGIGTTAIQLAKAFGASVITTSGSADKAAFCTGLGADLSLDYQTCDFVDAVKAFTCGRGVDVLLDIIAGDYVDRNLKIMAIDGRLIMIAVQHGAKISANILPIMLKRLTFTGSTLRAREVAFKADIAENLKSKVWPLIAQGKIRPVISKSFALTAAAEAHALLESGKNIGKILLEL